MKHSTFPAMLFLAVTALAAQSADAPPRIMHEPVTAAIKGQPLYIRATVRDDAGPASQVNLYCAASSDSAPFKIKMRASGAGSFIGTIPDNMIQGTSELSYYIEAMDSAEQSTETPWYTIRFKTANGKTPAASTRNSEKKSSWKKPLLIVGGTAAAIGIGAAVSGGGSSGSDSSSSTTEGLFAGTATRYLQIEGGSVTSEMYSVVFNLLSGGTLTTDSLHPGAHMTATVVGSTFTMSSDVSDGDLTGQINYNGSIADTKITGTISGDVVTGAGTNGTYSGVFSADKQ